MFERYLPTLKLKQQQLQLTLRQLNTRRARVEDALQDAKEAIAPYKSVLNDIAGLDVLALSQPEKVKTSKINVAGVNVPEFDGVDFPEESYSLFSTPVWVDKALGDLRNISQHKSEAEVLSEQHEILDHELTKISQRVNLFEKVNIPECLEAIRVIRIKLGDEMTAAVGRAKIAKSKVTASERDIYPKEHAGSAK